MHVPECMCECKEVGFGALLVASEHDAYSKLLVCMHMFTCAEGGVRSMWVAHTLLHAHDACMHVMLYMQYRKRYLSADSLLAPDSAARRVLVCKHGTALDRQDRQDRQYIQYTQ